jgi:hypothetical protein
MTIKVFENDEAKIFIKNEDQFKDILNDVYINEWYDEKLVKLYLLYNNDVIESFVLLIKMGRDPLKIHKNPYHLSYVYTFEQFRRQNKACEFLKEIKQNEEITVFCTDDISTELFKKAEFNFSSKDPLYNRLPIYRYP